MRLETIGLHPASSSNRGDVRPFPHPWVAFHTTNAPAAASIAPIPSAGPRAARRFHAMCSRCRQPNHASPGIKSTIETLNRSPAPRAPRSASHVNSRGPAGSLTLECAPGAPRGEDPASDVRPVRRHEHRRQLKRRRNQKQEGREKGRCCGASGYRVAWVVERLHGEPRECKRPHRGGDGCRQPHAPLVRTEQPVTRHRTYGVSGRATRWRGPCR